MKINGLVSAVFTPVNAAGYLNFTNLEKMAARLQEWGVHNIMVGGTTGESLSFTFDERLETVKAWLKIADKYDINVYVHTGMDSLERARELTVAVNALPGVKGIFCMPPVYFKPGSVEVLADSMWVVASGAPTLPFWYYHFPAKTGVDLNMYEFVKYVDEVGIIPNFMGVKFTNEIIMDFNDMGHYKNDKYNMLMGRDEIVTSALITGVCDGAVSSTINYMAFNVEVNEIWQNSTLDMPRLQAKQLQTV